eukprot:279325-Chlamydomonas_euryale.AAC.2
MEHFFDTISALQLRVLLPDWGRVWVLRFRVRMQFMAFADRWSQVHDITVCLAGSQGNMRDHGGHGGAWMVLK